jgi:transcriptional regulator with XRE-family HTH domain
MQHDLQKHFIQRLTEEMEARGLSDNQLAKNAKSKGYSIGQTTISLIKRGKQNPSLQKIQAIADGLGLPAWFLLADPAQVEQRILRPVVQPQPNGTKKVLELPSPYPKIFSEKARKSHKSPQPQRKKRVV